MSLDRYFLLGRSGLRVSPLALGTMTFGQNGKWASWGIDEKNSRAIFDRYIGAGGNFVDTADLYTAGTSETLVGKFIAEAKNRDRIVLATKYSYNLEPGNPNAGGNGRKNMMRAVEASLKRLQTDYIDLYILHTWDRITPVEEVMRTFDDLVRAGKIRYAGLSDVPAWYAARAQTWAEAHALMPIINLQLQYSLVERNIESEFVPLAQNLGMGITAWSPLGMGLLSGKYKPSTGGGEGPGRLTHKDPVSQLGLFNDRNWKITAELEKIAGELGRSMAQVALAWVAAQPGIASVILGATRIEQLDDNLGALDFELPLELKKRLDKASANKPTFPYGMFGPGMQAGMNGGVGVGDRPLSYGSPIFVNKPGAK